MQPFYLVRVFNLLLEVTLVTLFQNTAQIRSGVYGIWGWIYY